MQPAPDRLGVNPSLPVSPDGCSCLEPQLPTGFARPMSWGARRNRACFKSGASVAFRVAEARVVAASDDHGDHFGGEESTKEGGRDAGWGSPRAIDLGVA